VEITAHFFQFWLLNSLRIPKKQLKHENT